MRILYVFIPMILALTVHEFSHAFVAHRLGDDTASLQGRMTLNPISHIDPIGTILIPLVGMYSGVPFFGWAKPVPISPLHFTRRLRMKTGILLTAAAGPISNLIFAALMAVLLGILGPATIQDLLSGGKGIQVALVRLAGWTLLINVGLFIFNLIPIPPLDGSKVLAGFLPDRMYGILDFINKYSFILFILILVFGGRFIQYPVQYIIDGFSSLVGFPIWWAIVAG
jgi:Zn-dependent protease